MQLPLRVIKRTEASCSYFGEAGSGFIFMCEDPEQPFLPWTSIEVMPSSGGYYHGGEFDADGEWPDVGDTLFAIEQSSGKTDDIEWSAVRIQSSRGDMRAMVRDHGDPYGYGAGLMVGSELLGRKTYSLLYTIEGSFKIGTAFGRTLEEAITQWLKPLPLTGVSEMEKEYNAQRNTLKRENIRKAFLGPALAIPENDDVV